MKKILFFVITFSLMQFAHAQNSADIDYAQILNTTSMPSDIEIRKIVDNFNYSREEKERIFQETKKQLQEIYATQNAKLLEQKAIEGVEILRRGNLLPQDLID